MFDRVERLRHRYRVFVIGDWNTAHTEIDLVRRMSSGYSAFWISTSTWRRSPAAVSTTAAKSMR